MTITRRLVVWAAVTLLATLFVSGQTARPDFNRKSSFDVQHYTIRISFDRSKKMVFGDTTVTVKPLKQGFSQLELDAVDMAFESVKLDAAGTDLKYLTAPGKVVVTLDKEYGPGEAVSVRFKYSAQPKKGIYFRDPENGRSYQIWTQGEAEEARYWFPSFDFPSDKATTDTYITAETGYTVVGNGELIEKVPSGDTQTWHYKMSIPYSTYLVSFVIGRYSRVDDSYNGIPLGFYIYPGREQTAKNAYGSTSRMMAAYEKLTGVAFPFNKYDQTIVANFQFGGMENITATTMSDMEILMADTDFGKSIVGDLVSHELAHSWFGNLVTTKNWAELWLNEGFATYMEAAYREQAFSREDYIAKVQSDASQFMVDDEITRKRHGLFNRRAGNVDALFDNSSVTYNKGSAVVHMLREQVGSDVFWKGINSYLNRNKFANVESADLRNAMEGASGQDLNWFFDQWVYGVSYPRLSVTSTYSARTKTLTIRVAQTQKIDTLIPLAFRLPMDIRIRTASGETSEKMDIKKRIQTFTYKVDGAPTAIVFDPDNKILLKSLKQKSTTVLP